jgi:hypothetical protein
MILTSGINSIWKRRVVRVMAVFFLLYIAVDLATPQLCGEEAQRLALTGAASSRPVGIGDHAAPGLELIVSQDDSRPEPPPNQPHQEDCLGCCAHVLPGMVISYQIVIELKSPAAALGPLSLPSPPPGGTFHPPRFS